MSYFLSTTLIPFYKTSLTRYFSSKIKFSTVSPTVKNSDITPFKVAFSTELIKDLRNRLLNATVLSDKNFDNSNVINMNFLHKFINYWADTYDFQEREKYINKYPHFITNIRGLNVHFVHVKPNSSNTDLHTKNQVVPVLCLHKWFNSFMEFYNFIPLWTTPASSKDILFEMIIPSLPGFGFSTFTLSPKRMSKILQDLMFKLGHKEFDIQGGNSIDPFVPQVLKASNNSITDIYKKLGPELYFLESFWQILLSSQTSFKSLCELSTVIKHCHVGSEDILAIALRDSPVTLAAYFLEQYLKNVDYVERYNIENLNANSCNKLIDNLMIYWVSQSISTAMRMQANLANNFIPL